MSTRHLLNSEGEVVCGASPKEDGSNVTSDWSGASCSECRGWPVPAALDRFTDEELHSLLTRSLCAIRGIPAEDLDEESKQKIAEAVAQRNEGEGAR